MKFSFKKLVLICTILMVAILSGCEKYEIHKVGLNEECYLIPNKITSKDQKDALLNKSNSDRDYWESFKQTSKVIKVPKDRQFKTQNILFKYLPGNYVWTPTHTIATCNLRVVSREWVAGTRGSSTNDDSFVISTKNSNSFSLGAVISARIVDSSKYLSIYQARMESKSSVLMRAEPLGEVLDDVVKKYVQGRLSHYFGQIETLDCPNRQTEVFEKVKAEVIARFKEDGIEIKEFNISSKFYWFDADIAEMIANTAKTKAQKELLEAEKANDRIVKEKEAQARKIEAETKKYEAEKEKERQVLINEQKIAEAKAKNDIAKANAETELFTAQKKAKAIETLKTVANIEIKKMNAEADIIRANATLEEAKRWDGKRMPTFGQGSEVLIDGTDSGVNKYMKID